MKYLKHIYWLLAAFMVSCSVEEAEVPVPVTEDENIVFHASIEGEPSRAYVDENMMVLWNSDDRVSIFNKTTFNNEYAFTGEDGDNSGTFTKVPNENFLTANPLDLVYSVYPYQESTRISNDGILTVNLPSKQSYRENSFGRRANTMIAVSRDNELMFKNLCGYLALSLYGKNVSISSITIKGNNGEPIAGSASVTALLDSIPSLVFNQAETSDEISMAFDEPVRIGSTAEEATTFWFVVPPTVFKDGFTLTIMDSEKGVFEKITKSSLEIRRSIRSRMSALKVDPIPVKNFQPLTFEAIEDGSVSLDNPLGLTVEYSLDSTEWVSVSSSVDIFLTQGQKLFFRADNKAYAKTLDNRFRFTRLINSSPCYVYGNIMSLIDSKGFWKQKRLEEGCAFAFLFYYNRHIRNHPDKDLLLPATELSGECYENMFIGCSSLIKAPDLPAESLAEYCYNQMFSECTSLTNAPDLPAESLAGYCYNQMFSECTSLTEAPALPAKELSYGCYYQMFTGCTSLTKAPDLPAEFLVRDCYSGMFNGCSNLSYIKAMFLTGPSSGSFTTDWVQGVAPQGTFVKNSRATWNRTGADGVPDGWEIKEEEGKLVFNLMLYKKHTKGKAGVPLVILSDGFLPSELPIFMQRAKECYDFLFSVEPYKTYSDYFDAYIIEVPSEESGCSVTDGNGTIIKYVNCFFETRWGESSYGDMRANSDKIWNVVSLCPLDENQSYSQIQVALLVNDTRYGGICWSSSGGKAFCIIPYAHSGQTIGWSYPGYEASSDEDGDMVVQMTPSSVYTEMGQSRGDWKNIFIHEFGGHGFGRLGDEYWGGNQFSFKYWTSQTIPGHGWSVPMKLNLSAKYNSVPWQEFLDHKDELVSRDANYGRIGKYQGGEGVMFKVWRSEKISCMIDNRPYYAAWQRYLIARRIMTLAGEGDSFSFDSWLALDKTEDPIRGGTSTVTRSNPSGPVILVPPLAPPVMIEDE